MKNANFLPSFPTPQSPFILSLVIHHQITSYYNTPHHITSHHITSYYNTPHHITTYHITSYYNTPHHITHHTASYQVHNSHLLESNYGSIVTPVTLSQVDWTFCNTSKLKLNIVLSEYFHFFFFCSKMTWTSITSFLFNFIGSFEECEVNIQMNLCDKLEEKEKIR